MSSGRWTTRISVQWTKKTCLWTNTIISFHMTMNRLVVMSVMTLSIISVMLMMMTMEVKTRKRSRMTMMLKMKALKRILTINLIKKISLVTFLALLKRRKRRRINSPKRSARKRKSETSFSWKTISTTRTIQLQTSMSNAMTKSIIKTIWLMTLTLCLKERRKESTEETPLLMKRTKKTRLTNKRIQTSVRESVNKMVTTVRIIYWVRQWMNYSDMVNMVPNTR